MYGTVFCEWLKILSVSKIQSLMLVFNFGMWCLQNVRSRLLHILVNVPPAGLGLPDNSVHSSGSTAHLFTYWKP